MIVCFIQATCYLNAFSLLQLPHISFNPSLSCIFLKYSQLHNWSFIHLGAVLIYYKPEQVVSYVRINSGLFFPIICIYQSRFNISVFIKNLSCLTFYNFIKASQFFRDDKILQVTYFSELFNSLRKWIWCLLIKCRSQWKTRIIWVIRVLFDNFYNLFYHVWFRVSCCFYWSCRLNFWNVFVRPYFDLVAFCDVEHVFFDFKISKLLI